MDVITTINKQTEDTVNVTFTVANTQITASRDINIVGLDEAGITERIGQHQNTFKHRVNIGMIKAPSSESASTLLPGPAAIEAAAAIETPVEAPVVETPAKDTKAVKK